jgi:proteic killer suppression protein
MGERLVLTLEGSGVGLGVWREATCRNDFMDVQFVNPDLERPEGDAGFDGGYPPEAIRGFRKVMQVIRAAADERDLYAMKSLHFEKLKGSRQDERSLRLNRQWRLIVKIVTATPKNVVAVSGIEDYH